MFTGNHLTTSFKLGLLQSVHDFATHTFKISLYDDEATLNSETSTYVTENEVVGTGYTAGGKDLEVVGLGSDGTTAVVSFANVVWTDASFTARGALVYNSSALGNPSVAVLDFGANKVGIGSSFTVTFPGATAAAALVRIV